MDDKVKEILQKVRAAAGAAGEAAGRAAEAAGKKAGDMFEIAKLNVQVFDLNSEVDALYRKIGETVYMVHNGVEEENDSITAILEEIDAKKAEVRECKDKIESFRSSRGCGVCGKNSAKDAEYCSYCGARL